MSDMRFFIFPALVLVSILSASCTKEVRYSKEALLAKAKAGALVGAKDGMGPDRNLSAQLTVAQLIEQNGRIAS